MSLIAWLLISSKLPQFPSCDVYFKRSSCPYGPFGGSVWPQVENEIIHKGRILLGLGKLSEKGESSECLKDQS